MTCHELTFGRRIELNFRYTCNSLLVDDADGDGNLEICAGSRDGVLCVYKLDQPDPWRVTAPTVTPSGSIGGPFGLITALAVGDLFNKGMTVLVSIAADGSCNACRLVGNGLSTGSDQVIQPCFRQLLPSNIKGAHIGDIDGDGRCELIVALTDRVVRTYRFLPCATSMPVSGSTAPTTTRSTTGMPHPTSGTGFCCGYLVALNKWESPAQITAFSVCPSNSLPDSGATVLLSQPGDKYLLLKPKLCPENDPADSLSDISVVYCETTRVPAMVQKTSGHGTEHRSSQKSSHSKSDGSSEKRKRRLFVAANSYRIDLFHLTSRYVSIVDHNHEHRIEFPTQIFSMTPLKVLLGSAPPPGSPGSASIACQDLLVACDWSNNVYVCAVDGATMGGSPRRAGKEDEKLHRITSIATMKVYGPVMCFAAGLSEGMTLDDLIVAVSTCEEKLFLYSVRVSKVLKTLGKGL